MIALFLLAGLGLTELPLDDPVLDVRIADIDADDREEIIAVTGKELVIVRADGKTERRPVTPLTIVGRGLLAVCGDEGLVDLAGKRLGPRPLLNALGRGDPVLLDSPGDLDGDGRDDPIYSTLEGIVTPGGLVPVRPAASLEIGRAEAFAVQYTLPVASVGRWSGAKPELVVYDEGTIRSFDGTRESDRLELPLQEFAQSAEGIRRNEVFVNDLDRDGRLDLLLVMARGSLKVFADFEVNVWEFRGGRVYDRERKGFYRPATALKVSGALLDARLFDADGDGDLDLALTTISTSILSAATAQYLLFRCEEGKLERNPSWQHEGVVPIESLKREPDPPATIVPDLDGDGRPELIVRGAGVRLLRGTEEGGFAEAARHRGTASRPVAGRRQAVMIGGKGLLVAR